MDPSATEGKDETKQARVTVAPVDAQDDSDDDHAEDEVAEDDEDILNDWPDDTQVSRDVARLKNESNVVYYRSGTRPHPCSDQVMLTSPPSSICTTLDTPLPQTKLYRRSRRSRLWSSRQATGARSL